MRLALDGIRRLAALPPLRPLRNLRPLLRATFALRGYLVREPLRFARNELRRGSVVACYSVRSSGIAVCLRHHTPDVLVLDDIFARGEYELPPVVEHALGRVAHPIAILDVGANIGLFGAWVLGRFPDARITAFEPDPSNAELHRRAIDASGRSERWRLIEAFAGTCAGSVRFHAGRFTTSRAAGPDESGSIERPLVDLFEHTDHADLLKLDVEGAEWPILADPRFRRLPARAIALEYHEHRCPGGSARAVAQEALIGAGYSVVPGHREPAAHGGLLWGWRE